MNESGIPPVFKDINGTRLCGTMKAVLILAFIVAMCTCSDNSSEKKFEEEAENSKLSFCAEDKTNTSMKDQQSQADKQHSNEVPKKFRKDELERVGKRVKVEMDESENNSLIQRLAEDKFFKPEDRALCISLVRKILRLTEDVSEGEIEQTYYEAGKSYWFFVNFYCVSSEVQDAFLIMDTLVSGLGWSSSWEASAGPELPLSTIDITNQAQSPGRASKEDILLSQNTSTNQVCPLS
jgi:hypothetical protein